MLRELCSFFACLYLAVVLALPLGAQPAQILAQKCIHCHGQASAMGNLDLRTRQAVLKGGQHGPAIVPGNAAASRLYLHIAGQAEPRMPLGDRLADQEIATIRQWIDAGAPWDSASPLEEKAPAVHTFTEKQRQYWAFQRVTKPPVPAVRNRAWVGTPLHALVLAKLEE